MASLNSSNFGLIHFQASKYQKLSADPIKSASFSEDCGYMVNDNSDLYQVLLPSLECTQLSTSVLQVSCSLSAVAFVTTTGFLLTMGEDPEKSGILGLKSCFSLKSPTKVPINTRIISVSLSNTHGAVLSNRGELYTWGSGLLGELGSCNYGERLLPSIVQTAKIFLIKQVVCGLGLTAFVTAGGFVYIYGQLPKCESEELDVPRQPYTIKGMCDHFIVKIEYCRRFLALVTDKKEVFVVDGCMNTNKLAHRFSKVACADESIIGIVKADKLVHEFVSVGNECNANELKESAHFIDEVFTHKFLVFSGFFVAISFFSVDKPIGEVHMQQVSLEKVKIDNSDLEPVSAELGVKKSLGKVVTIFNMQRQKLMRKALFEIKVLAKYRKMVVEKPVSMVLMPIFTRMMTKTLVMKRTVWVRLMEFVESSKKICELKVLKRAQSIQIVFLKVYKKLFNLIIDTFELHRFWKNHKNHIAERIFSFLSRKRLETKRQGFTSVRKFAINKKLIKRNINRLFHLIEKNIKLKFIQLLLQNHIVKLKIYEIITQIVAYSAAQNSRVRILKFFHIWKRNLVSQKIARISQKYVTSMKTKKLADKLMQLLRKQTKLSFTSLKNYTRPNPHKFKVIFLSNSLKPLLSLTQKPAFHDLKHFSKTEEKFQSLLKSLLKSRFSSVLLTINSFITSRKFILLLKILTKKLTKSSNFAHRQLFKAFIKLSSFFNPNPQSPSLTPKSFIRNRVSSPSLSISSNKPQGRNSLSKLMPKSPTHTVQRKSLRTVTFPELLNKLPSPKNKKGGKGTRSPTLTLQKQFTLTEDINCSFFSSATEISPVSAGIERTPKKFLQWEEHIMALGTAILNSLLKSYLKGYVRLVVR